MSEIRVSVDSKAVEQMFGSWESYVAFVREAQSKVGPPPDDCVDGVSDTES